MSSIAASRITPPSTSPQTAQARSATENRNSPRRPASRVPAITGLRISPHGAAATLVDISATGLLAECAVRLQPGSAVTVVVEGTFAPASIEGRVARTSVSCVAKDGTLRYHSGIAFNKPIALAPEPDVEPRTEAPVPVAAAAEATPKAPLRNRW
jgi:hypothetical protein